MREAAPTAASQAGSTVELIRALVFSVAAEFIETLSRFPASFPVNCKNRMRRLLTALLLVSTTLLSAAPARSYTLQTTEGTTPAQLSWKTRRITVTLSSSLVAPPANIKQGSDLLGAVRRALAHWSAAANIQFVEAASKAESISAVNSGGDGVSLITAAHTPENAAPFNGPSSDASGRTRIFYTESGHITEADIALNPAQQFSTDGTYGTYDLEATLTHEIGHLLGLEHSAIAGATMQPRQGKNGLYKIAAWTPRTLADDDRAGVRALYGARGEKDKSRGAVTGTISYAGGAPAYGANVWAEEVETGRVAASNITLSNGTYRIEGLSPGDYRLWVEALDGIVPASEIASGRGHYTGLALNPLPPFRTQEIGRVKLAAGVIIRLNAQLSSLPVLLNPAFIGINEQLSTIAVPLTAGRTYTVYLGGDGVSANQISAGGITVASPFVSINPASVTQRDFGGDLLIMSFELTISPNAPSGDYSVRLNSNTGEVACLAGALSIEGLETTAASPRPLSVAPIDALDRDETALFAGSFVKLSGAGLADESMAAVGPEFGSAAASNVAPLGAPAVQLIYSSGATAYLPLTQVSRTRLGFQIPDNAEPGQMLVEVFLNGQKTASVTVEITNPETALSAQEDSSRIVNGEGSETDSVLKAGTED
jgi:predicted Zn-dependent protease